VAFFLFFFGNLWAPFGSFFWSACYYPANFLQEVVCELGADNNRRVMHSSLNCDIIGTGKSRPGGGKLEAFTMEKKPGREFV
jgi:hypothetical protein